MEILINIIEKTDKKQKKINVSIIIISLLLRMMIIVLEAGFLVFRVE